MPREIAAPVRSWLTISLPTWDFPEISVAVKAACLPTRTPQVDGAVAERSTRQILTVEEPALSVSIRSGFGCPLVQYPSLNLGAWKEANSGKLTDGDLQWRIMIN